MTEVGTVELWCQSRTDDRRWRLQIQLRGPAGQLAAARAGHRRRVRPGRHRAIGARRGDRGDPDGVRGRRVRAAERARARPGWSSGSRKSSTCRATSGRPRPCAPSGSRSATWPTSGSRARGTSRAGSTSPASASGPGRGFPLDEVRIKALWPIFHQGVKHIKDVQCWAEWWILWRRVAAGPARPHHDEIYRRLAPFLLPAKGSSPAKKAGRPKPEPHELAEMWRCAASLERLAPEIKESLGDAPDQGASAPHLAGPRPLVPGPARCAGPALRPGQHGRPQGDGRALDRGRCSAARSPRAARRPTPIFALAQLARVANDRARDLDETLRDRGARPARRAGRRRGRVCGRCASTTSSRPPSRARPWAMRCRSACGCSAMPRPARTTT